MQVTPVSKKEEGVLGEVPKTEPTHIIVQYKLGSKPQLEKSIRNGEVVIGRLHVYKHHMSGLAFVRSPAFPSDIVVDGMDNRKRVLHDDIVAVRLLTGKREGGKGAKENNNDNNNNNNNNNSNNNNGGEENENEDNHNIRTNDQSKEDDEEEEEIEIEEEDDEEFDEENPEDDGKPVDQVSEGRPITSWIKDTTQKTVISPELQLAQSLSAPTVYNWGNEQPRGTVMAVLKRRLPIFVAARLMKNALPPGEMIQSNRYYLFKSFNRLMPNIAVYGRDIPSLYHKTLYDYFFHIRLVTQENGDAYWTGNNALTGKIVRVLGGADSIRTNSFALCNANGIDMSDFSEEAYACVPEVFNVPDKEALKQMRRRDLREEEFVCSIDPSTARDLDDALSITTTPGGYRVGVHIADVSYFVPANSALDEEARGRSTSVYLIEQVIPMLPRKLSEDYCSLNPGSDKFAFSCIFHFDHHGKLTSEWFGQSVIRNRCRLAYEEAQRILDGDLTVLDTLDYGGEEDTEKLQHLKERVNDSIQTLFKLASKLRAMSIERGRVSIGKRKIRFEFEDISNPSLALGFNIEQQIESNWLVEEFMLLANRRVAEKIVEYMPEQALLRCHGAPFSSSINKLRKSLAHVGLFLQGSSNKSLQTLLNSAKGTDNYDSVCVAVKYVMQSAKYFVNGQEEMVCKGHYALALPWYTHFTSPIRRYCDIIAHRQLLCALEIESIVKKSRHRILPGSIDVDDLETKDFFYSVSEIDTIVEMANVKKLNARTVSDVSEGLFLCFYLQALKRSLDADIHTRGTFDNPRVEVTIVQLKGNSESIKLYAREIAQEVEISLRSKEQRFTYIKGGETTKETAAAVDKNEKEEKPKQESHGKKKEKGQQQQEQQQEKEKEGEKKMRKAKKPTGDNALTFRINWGPHPDTGEEVEEELRLLKELTAVLTTWSPNGYVELNMIIDPPWERTNKLTGIPTKLEEK
ncbi:ribonuclease II-like protein [Trypanosoma theileri]|uniref:Ribonuclease II-like protein n=1 Tax=Trypanosoma theileri TaxID=67003 RepID=A0A1X0NYL5_9TRYP|nr:ribonuclease II-like protein [Trypanosoma theileri]ORC89775.1 ribonuclease II-like protein [Trypanosoma theileri]